MNTLFLSLLALVPIITVIAIIKRWRIVAAVFYLLTLFAILLPRINAPTREAYALNRVSSHIYGPYRALTDHLVLLSNSHDTNQLILAVGMMRDTAPSLMAAYFTNSYELAVEKIINETKICQQSVPAYGAQSAPSADP